MIYDFMSVRSSTARLEHIGLAVVTAAFTSSSLGFAKFAIMSIFLAIIQ